MMFYTQLVFLNEGQTDAFDEFEEGVLDLLAKHGGTLLYRIRPEASNVVVAAEEVPYEIHVITFPGREDFERYMQDDGRQALLGLKERAVRRVMLIEGRLV